MVDANFIKTFKIQDAESGKDIEVDMKVIDYINYRLLKEIAEAIRNLR